MKNIQIRLLSTEILSDNWYVLRKISYEYEQSDGTWIKQTREAYDRGNGATILLYHPVKKTVILTRQFRLPTYVNGNETGMLIETPAGLLDNDNPEDCIRRETEEETGFQVKSVRKIFEAYMSPGSVTEVVYFFVAEYADSMKLHEGGGAIGEHENIQVMEIPFIDACQMMHTGEIKDGKTIMLLQYANIHHLV